MPHPRFASGEICKAGEELYNRTIRSQIETAENIGKLVSIDVETGDYVLSIDESLDAPHSLLKRDPGAAIYTKRIGYKAAYSLWSALS